MRRRWPYALLAGTMASAVGGSLVFEALLRRSLFGLSGRGSPSEIGAPALVPDGLAVQVEQVRFSTPDGHHLDGWFFKPSEEPLATILYLRGRGQAFELWATEERATAFARFLQGIGCAFFVFDYRGSPGGNGRLTERGSYLDAEGALAYLRARTDVDPKRLVYYGFSLGTGVAVELARRRPAAGLVLRAPFTSVRDLVKCHRPRLRPLMALAPWLPMTRYDSAAKIGMVRMPLLIMHGDADELIPYWMGRRLYELAPGPKRFVTFPNSGHSQAPMEALIEAVRSFVEEFVAQGQPNAHGTLP